MEGLLVFMVDLKIWVWSCKEVDIGVREEAPIIVICTPCVHRRRHR